MIRTVPGKHFFVTMFLLAAGVAHASTVDLSDATADEHLQPGDVLFKVIDESPSSVQKWIIGAQRVIRKMVTPLSKNKKGIEKGDPRAVHAMVYVGGGQVAEASSKAKKVLLRTLSHQYLAGQKSRLLAYRLKDAGLRARFVEVARRWAESARMAYSVPVTGALDASFGSKAKAAAVKYGKAFARVGGPQSVSKMYCNEFVTAAMQAAALTSSLQKGKANYNAVPLSARIHASHSTPMLALGQLRLGVESKEATAVGTFRVLEK